MYGGIYYTIVSASPFICFSEAPNSLFNYDLISICETALDDTIELPQILINDYTFLSSNNPKNTKHRGVGLFYKNSLPIKVKDDLFIF